jgi:hypothetical protein
MPTCGANPPTLPRTPFEANARVGDYTPEWITSGWPTNWTDQGKRYAVSGDLSSNDQVGGRQLGPRRVWGLYMSFPERSNAAEVLEGADLVQGRKPVVNC